MKSTITGIGNAKVAVTGEGSVKFNNGQLLENVLLPPDAANLISISAATRKGAKFVFVGDNIYVGKTIVGKRVSNGLYECLFLIGSVALVSFNILIVLVILVHLLKRLLLLIMESQMRNTLIVLLIIEANMPRSLTRYQLGPQLMF